MSLTLKYLSTIELQSQQGSNYQRIRDEKTMCWMHYKTNTSFSLQRIATKLPRPLKNLYIYTVYLNWKIYDFIWKITILKFSYKVQCITKQYFSIKLFKVLLLFTKYIVHVWNLNESIKVGHICLKNRNSLLLQNLSTTFFRLQDSFFYAIWTESVSAWSILYKFNLETGV